MNYRFSTEFSLCNSCNEHPPLLLNQTLRGGGRGWGVASFNLGGSAYGLFTYLLCPLDPESEPARSCLRDPTEEKLFTEVLGV